MREMLNIGLSRWSVVLVGGIAAGALLVDVGPAMAQTPGIVYSGGASARNDNITYGNLFTVGSTSLTITALGVQDVNGTGLPNSFDVGIWNANGSTELASATVTPADSGAGGSLEINTYAYDTSLTIPGGGPLVLQPNTNYLIGVFNENGGHANWWDISPNNGATFKYAGNTDVTLDASNFNSSNAGLAAPAGGNGNGAGAWGPANFLSGSAAVPEPASLGLLSLAGLGLFARRRRN